MENGQSLSICMICKNEEKRLEPLLKSASAIADEIIFVDTGSTDHSMLIARQFGAKVFEYQWNDDFSGPRNFALQNAKLNYVLCLDCDDCLTEDAMIGIRQFVHERKAEGCYIRYESKVIHGKHTDILVDYKLTLFRNRKDYEFRGKIHETIEESMAERLDLADIPVSDITIYHDGYEDNVAIKAKNERNLRIIQKSLMSDGDDLFLRYCEGTCYLGLNQYDLALKSLVPLKNKWPYRHPLHSDVLYKIIDCLFETEKWDEAQRELKVAIECYPDFTDLYYILGCIDYQIGNYQEARNIWFSCLDLGDAPEHYLHLKGAGALLAWRGIVQTFIAEKKYNLAVDTCVHFISKCFYWLETFGILSDILNLFPNSSILHFAEAAEEREQLEFAYVLLTLELERGEVVGFWQYAFRILGRMVDENQ